MAIIKCKMCGGDIVLSEDRSFGTCEYCGSTMTFPKVSDEQKLNLFNRANHFRRQNEFDKAIAAYDKILDQDDADAEAHWGAVLSRYGIEYVEDPVTHERIPTCHRVQPTSILTDPDYLAALEHAPDGESRGIYEQEARRIADIQKGILAISSQEKPYDVFICYKESDDSGSRTVDSTLAQEIYYQLTNEGYKVFFSRITLEDKLGQQYEPYIFAALNSAKVMLVIGTRPEYFSAVWVKNEWSRFLALMKNDRSKLLIPCYRGMDPYDLPEELSSLQSQDMAKIGFIQDITRGIKKVLDDGKGEQPLASPAAPGISSLHKRAVLFLEDGDWDAAREYFDRILDIDPEYAPAYIGKTQVTLKVRKEEGLARCSQPLKDNPNYQKALRFANEQQKAVYSGYNRAIEERLELERKEAAYREADALEKRAAVEKDFLSAAKRYDDAGEIRDAKERAANCRAKAVAAKEAAERQAEEYRRQLEQEREERRRKEEEARVEAERKAEEQRKEAERRAEQRRIEDERRAEEQRIENEKRRKRNRLITTIAAIAAVLAVAAYGVNTYVIQPRNRYNAAQALLEAGELADARAAYEELDNYEDSAAIIGRIDAYSAAKDDESKGKYVSARAGYAEAGDFLDAVARREALGKALYDGALKKQAEGDIAGAYKILSQISDYADSAEIVAGYDGELSSALEMWKNGDKSGAEAALVPLAGVGDASAQLDALREEMGDDAAAAGDYDTALAYFGKLSEKTEAVQGKITAATQAKAYGEAVAALDSGDLKTARAKFVAAGSYQDAADQAAKLDSYVEANKQLEDKHYDVARPIYVELGDYLDAPAKLETCNSALYQGAGKLMEQGDVASAVKVYTLLGDYSDCKSIVDGITADYQAATELFQQGRYTEAAEAFAALKNYSDSGTQANESLYQNAAALANEGQYADAIDTYTALNDYLDSADRVKAVSYDWAGALWKAGNRQEAAELYKNLGEYSDAAQQLTAISAEIADVAMEEKDYTSALTAYQRLEQTDEVKVKEYDLAQICYEEGHYAEATAAYETLGQFELSLSKLPIARYAWADQLFAEGSYAEAAEQFALLGDMTDSAERAKESTYQQAKQLLDGKDYANAKATFQSIKGYSDADTLVQECDYRTAAALMTDGKYKEAETAFKALGQYSDSAEQAKACVYAQAETLFAAEDYTGAQALYATIDYSDSASKAKLSAYNAAGALYAAGDYAGAEKVYKTIPGYEDSADLAKDCHLKQGAALMDGGDYENALTFLDGLDYLDSASLAEQCRYQLGHANQVNGAPDAAVEQYIYALSLPETQGALLSIGKDYAATNQTEKAVQVLWLVRDNESASSMLKEIGDLKAMTGEVKQSLIARLAVGDCELQELGEMLTDNNYALLGETLDTCELLPEDLCFADEIRYTFAASAYANQAYNIALTAFNSIDDYKDSATMVLECQYQMAAELNEAGQYDEAYAAFAALKGYRDVDSIIENDDNIAAAAAAAWRAQFNLGNTVQYGHYEQDNDTSNGVEAIEWVVLANDGEFATLISKYGLDVKPYNAEKESVTWETCTLREWLNGDFLNAAFNVEELAKLETVTVTADKNPKYNTSPGNSTQDTVFLLSIDEVNVLFSGDDSRRCEATAHAKAQGAYVSDNGNSWWWLRSPGFNSGRAAYVSADGSVRDLGDYVGSDFRVVRPVVVLRLL